MDDPNITIEEYIMLEEEKARKCGKVFNWETPKYGKIWYDEDIHDLRSVETEFPAISFNDGVSSEKTLSCEPTISSLNDEIDFKISFDDSDDEDYTNDETSLSEFDEEEHNILYFNDLFPFNIIQPDLKSEKDDDDNEVDIIQSSGGNEITQGSNMLFETSHDKINETFRTGSLVMELNVNIERIEMTKRSKNDQKPTRNGKRQRVKSKSEKSAKDHSRISPTQSNSEIKRVKGQE
ncbi:hypothetical protein Tco_1179558 [Tanacetum coccineum]